MLFADTPSVENDPVAGLEVAVVARLHKSGEVDSGYHRKRSNDRSLARDRERVLVVEGAVLDVDGDVYPSGDCSLPAP